jgi:hypothetical protein
MVTEARETGSLIGSDKVEGTAVYGANDTKIGSIERVMIDKMSGKVSYAVLSFGGFLGIGDDHYPLPWQSLKYDTNPAQGRAEIRQRQRLELERSCENTLSKRLLWRRHLRSLSKKNRPTQTKGPLHGGLFLASADRSDLEKLGVARLDLLALRQHGGRI